MLGEWLTGKARRRAMDARLDEARRETQDEWHRREQLVDEVVKNTATLRRKLEEGRLMIELQNLQRMISRVQ